MNRLVYPVPESRFARDMTARAPGIQVLPATLGQRYRVSGGQVSLAGLATELVEGQPSAADDRVFRPFEIAELCDPNPHRHDQATMQDSLERWLRDSLTPALAAAYPSMQANRSLSLVAELVLPGARRAFTITVGGEGARLRAGFDDDYDVLNCVAASYAFDVIEGRRHWGEPLLGGFLRASERSYAVSHDGWHKTNVAPIFFYYGLSYEESVRRMTEYQLESL